MRVGGGTVSARDVVKLTRIQAVLLRDLSARSLKAQQEADAAEREVGLAISVVLESHGVHDGHVNRWRYLGLSNCLQRENFEVRE